MIRRKRRILTRKPEAQVKARVLELRCEKISQGQM
jgi:hypothetical protein